MFKRILFLATLLIPSIAFADTEIAGGSTLQCFDVFVSDSSSTTGAGLTGLAYNTAGLSCYHYRQNAGTGATSITLVTSTLGTHPGASNGGFKQIDSTNMPGHYEFCVPDAAIASSAGVNWVMLQCKGATNMAPMNLRVTLRSANSFGFDGKLAAKSGTTLTLATSAVDADDQFNDGFAIVLYDSAGLVEAKSCIVDSTNTGETILTAADISSLISVNDNYIVQPDAGCKLDNASVELAACPNGTSSLGTMIKYLYQLGRHKLTQTSSTGTLFKDDASTSLCTFSNSDNGTTFTRGEAS